MLIPFPRFRVRLEEPKHTTANSVMVHSWSGKNYRRKSGSGVLADIINLVPCPEFLMMRHRSDQSGIKVSDVGTWLL